MRGRSSYSVLSESCPGSKICTRFLETTAVLKSRSVSQIRFVLTIVCRLGFGGFRSRLVGSATRQQTTCIGDHREASALELGRGVDRGRIQMMQKCHGRCGGPLANGIFRLDGQEVCVRNQDLERSGGVVAGRRIGKCWASYCRNVDLFTSML
jgi:hypothetical protein